MPVVGPVDMWINYRFEELGALALSSPEILQRPDSVSDNSYSILPFLARAGIVDASSGPMSPGKSHAGPVLAWTAVGEHEGLAMALSMLGLRVRAFDGDEKAIKARDLPKLFEMFDALVDVPLTRDALSAAIARTDSKFVLEMNAALRHKLEPDACRLPDRGSIAGRADVESWEPLSTFSASPNPSGLPCGSTPRFEDILRDDRPDQWRIFVPADVQPSSWTIRLGSCLREVDGNQGLLLVSPCRPHRKVPHTCNDDGGDALAHRARRDLSGQSSVVREKV